MGYPSVWRINQKTDKINRRFSGGDKCIKAKIDNDDKSGRQTSRELDSDGDDICWSGGLEGKDEG